MHSRERIQTMAWLALVAFVFALPWERNVDIPVVGAAGTLLGLVAFGLAIVSAVNGRRLSLRRPSVFLVLMAGFVAWSFLTYYWSVSPDQTFDRALTYVQMFAMVWIVWQVCRTEEQRRGLLQAFVVGGYVAILSVLADFAAGRAFYVGSTSERYAFAAGDPNYLAASLALGIPMAWYLFESSRGRFVALANLAYLPLVLIVIGLTGSRGGFVTAIAAMAIVPLSYPRLGFWRRFLLVASIGAFLYGAFTLLPPKNLERLTSIGDDIVERDFANRENIWGASVDLLRDDARIAWIGAGSGAFPEAIEPLLGARRASHSAYISVWVETGVVGLLLFLALFAIAVLPTAALPTAVRNLCLVLGLALVVAIAPVSWEAQKTLWFLLGLLTSYRALVLPAGTSAARMGTLPRRGAARLHEGAD